ncbi:MAG: hypothetical protein KKA16_02070 [Alphaproteobacteria bacterium]|nr:hypothetical protein [Alphaproteobacteria bacterium]MBU2377884.1 hypothetical protein [Alphaproteobacteria bacterium]
MRRPPRKLRWTAFALALVVGAMPLVRAETALAAATALQQAFRSPARAAASRSADHQNRAVRIHNQTGWTMAHLYASGGGDWGGNLLGSRPLAPGNSIVVTVDDGSGACLYSLRAEFQNGQSLEREGLNACEVADYYYTR